MPIQFPCKSCGQTLSVAEEHAGKQARCPSCQTVQPVPGGDKNTSPSPLSFGGSVFDSPTPSSSAPNIPTPNTPTPSTPTSPGNDPLFGNRSASNPPSGSPGGGLFDGLGVEKLEPIEPKPAASSGYPGGVFGDIPASSNAATNSNSSNPDNYYLEAPGGAVYGPVDWRTLVAWKNQGRVGPGYRIRKGENGSWQIASSTELYATSANPFADTVPSTSYSSTPQYQYAYSQQDRSGLILALGIIAWVSMLICGPFGIISGILAWIFGAQDLRSAREGKLNPSTVTTIQIGYYLGMSQVLLSVLCFGGYFLFVIIAIMSGEFR